MSVSLTLEALVGSDPAEAIKAAVKIARKLEINVTMEMNGVEMVVTPKCYIDQLVAEYRQRLEKTR